MLRMAGSWKRRFGSVVASAFLLTALGLGGCATFQEKPGHSPFASSRARKEKKHSSMNPMSGLGSMFKRDDPKLAESPDEFVGLPRPEW